MLAMCKDQLENSGASIVYSVSWESVPTKAQRMAIERIAGASEGSLPESGSLVVPKRGLLSAWTAKATDILRQCGLPVTRIERAVFHISDLCDFHDPMLEEVLADSKIALWQGAHEPVGPLANPSCPLGNDPKRALASLLGELGLAVHPAVTGKMAQALAELNRDPTLAEVTTLAQLNSDHCRHWTFRSSLEGVGDQRPMLESIKSTLLKAPEGTLVAFSDNAAVLEFGVREGFAPLPGSRSWQTVAAEGELLHTVFKSETHNHPTAIAPFPGAATGVGGEIRDEAATGAGAASIAGFTGYIVSNLDFARQAQGRSASSGLSDPLRILLDAPLGAAAYSNEFGRPVIAGVFRTLEEKLDGRRLGFRKPVMLAGGLGEIRASAIKPRAPRAGDLLMQLGGPGMRIGIGGGSASSAPIDHVRNELASVQRDNAEMQRRVQQVIESCFRDTANPLRNLHDVGAGGLANAVAELADPFGCLIELESVPVAQDSLNETEILGNEAQERYVALVAPEDQVRLEKECAEEGCPVAAIGKITEERRFKALRNGSTKVDLPSASLFLNGELGPLLVKPWAKAAPRAVDPTGLDLARASHLVLAHPAVSDKSFLVTIADRSVGGLTARDQLVGPWQVAAADCGVTLAGHRTRKGRAFALGERAPAAVRDPAAAARIAIAEALTNIAAAPVGNISDVKLSLNWMADASTPEGLGELVAAVRGACEEFLLSLGLAVPSGKDSVSMRADILGEDGSPCAVSAPATCVAVACGHVNDVRLVLTPVLSGRNDTVLMRLAVGASRDLGGSVLAQALGLEGNDVPDVDPDCLRSWWETVSMLRESNTLLAYHDVSDGGMLATVCEMAFASRRGITMVMDAVCQPQMGLDADGVESSADTVSPGGIARVAKELFCEGTGAVVEVERSAAAKVIDAAQEAGMKVLPQTIGWPNRDQTIKVFRNASLLVHEPIDELLSSWGSVSAKVRSLRDSLEAAEQERKHTLQPGSGLYASRRVHARHGETLRRPAATVLRDQGTNGHLEMAAALDAVGFAVSIVPLRALLNADELSICELLVLPGGFSHGDVLGAGAGTAHVILENDTLRRQFKDFFARPTLTLGICNGCQVLSRISKLYAAGATAPVFEPNASRRFESRLAQVEILPSPSPFLARLAGMRLPVPISCGEGRASLPAGRRRFAFVAAMRFVDENGLPATSHPRNPTGSDAGLCGFTTHDGKVTMLMPHPERAVRIEQMSWKPADWQEATPWHDCLADAREELLMLCDN